MSFDEHGAGEAEQGGGVGEDADDVGAALDLLDHNAKVVHAGFEWNYTTILNLIFLALAAVLVTRFLRTGGPAMLKMMGKPDGDHAHDHHHHQETHA